MKPPKKILVIFLVSVGLIIFLALILRFYRMSHPVKDDIAVESFSFYQVFPTPGSDLDFVEQDADIEILSSASEIHAFITGFNELDSFVRFNLPPSDLAKFLESTLCQTELVSAAPQDYQSGAWDQEWWQPSNSTSLFICEGENSYTRQQILVDKSNEDSLIIYVLTSVGNYATPTE